MYDLVIKGGRLYDGSGLPSYHGDVAIADGKIVAVGEKLGGSVREEIKAMVSTFFLG